MSGPNQISDMLFVEMKRTSENKELLKVSKRDTVELKHVEGYIYIYMHKYI
jgi:hypothetical protein